MTTIASRIVNALAGDIINGVLSPGHRLEEKALAERFAVSRTPVREALREMGARGLIDLVPRRGGVVANIGMSELSDMLEAECEVESLCAQLAAQRMGMVEKKRLESLHQQIEAHVRDGALAQYLDLNKKFHDLICTGTRNRTIAELVRGLRDRLAPFRQAQEGTERRLEVAQEEHAAVVEAILTSDGSAAYAAMRNHNARLSTRVLDRLREARLDRAAPGHEQRTASSARMDSHTG
ncbi:MAG: GntR family transcriptional regulator [Burkholderiales bacterium]|nr:GntR family transcriptional regulator [Burkholderiales bacterium]